MLLDLAFARGGGRSDRSGDRELDDESTDDDLTGDFDFSFSSSDSLLLDDTLYSGRL